MIFLITALSIFIVIRKQGRGAFRIVLVSTALSNFEGTLISEAEWISEQTMQYGEV